MELERSCQLSDLEEQLPGFRFHPTEEELLNYYLKGVAHGKRSGIFDIIGNVNIYGHEPWELPGLAKIGDREWYFFLSRDRKNGANGGRPTRTTETGFWKATGLNRQIRHAKEPKRVLGSKKTLVFYMGRAPRGTKTDWVMNEYRLPDTCTMAKEEIVLCKIYRKATSLKLLEQRAAMGEGPVTMVLDAASFSRDANSTSDQDQVLQKIAPLSFEQGFKHKEVEREEEMISSCQVIDQRSTKEHLSELHVPAHGSFYWGQDPFLLCSPWMENWVSFVNAMFNY